MKDVEPIKRDERAFAAESVNAGNYMAAGAFVRAYEARVRELEEALATLNNALVALVDLNEEILGRETRDRDYPSQVHRARAALASEPTAPAPGEKP